MLRRNVFSVVVAAALVGVATPAFAQVCTGFAMAPGATQAALMGQFPDGSTTFGVDVARKANDQVIFGAGYAYTSNDDVMGVELPAAHSFTGFGSYEIALNAGSTGPSFVACPNARLSYTKWDEISTIGIPLGVAFSSAFEVAEGILLAPYVNPFFQWARSSVDGTSNSDTEFGWALGGNMSITSGFLVGAEYNKVGDFDGVFGIRFGLIF